MTAMTTLTLPVEKIAELAVRARFEGERIELDLVGTADLRVAGELDQVLQCVHDQAVSRHLRQVDVNLKELEFMNSSCFKSFVSWIGRLQELPEGQQYRVRLLSDPNVIWQKRSLQALSCFAANLITVEHVSAA